jgi:hypothetical protein
MSLIEAVRWPRVIEQLAGGVGDETRQAAVDLARDTSIERTFRAGVGLAAIVCGCSPFLVRQVLAESGAATARDADRLTQWLIDTAPIVLRIAAGNLEDGIVQPQTGTLYVDPALPDLPLLPLAAQVAERGGGLRVLAVTLPRAIGGVHTRDDNVIRLDPRNDPALYFPHELAHQLDPHIGKRGNPVLDEMYADTLARLLVEHQPWTWDDALPLVGQAAVQVDASPLAEQAAAGTPDPDLPAAGADSVIAFALLLNRV